MKKSILAIAVILFAAGTVYAQGQNAPAGEAKPCQSDVKKLCPKVEWGTQAMVDCLKPSQDKLSSECKTWVTERDKKIAESKVACQVDRDKFCKDVTPGNGAVSKCLKTHMMKLSRKCAEHLPSDANYVID